MVLNQEYRNIIKQISLQICETDFVCRNNVVTRMQNFGTDLTFKWMLERFNNGRFYIAQLLFERYVPPANLALIHFVYTDYITGETGADYIRMPGAATPAQVMEILKFPESGLINYGGKTYIFFQNPNIEGYNLTIGNTGTVTPSQTQTGGAGSVYIPPPKHTPMQPAPIPQPGGNITSKMFEGFDIGKLVLPGIMVIGAYMVLKK